MIGRYFIVCFTIATFLSSCSSQVRVPLEKEVSVQAPRVSPPGEPTELYVLGEGDTIDMQVWRQEGLKRSLKVDLQGNINVPLAGTIRVAGLTVEQATKEVCKRLDKYFVDPQVDLFVSGSKAQTVNIFGEVSTPGPYTIDHKTTVWEVVAKAGTTKISDKSNVVVIRNAIPGSDPANVKVFSVNVDPAKLKAGAPPGNYYVQSGDIIYVAPTFIADVDKVMTHIAAILAPIFGMESGILLIPQVWDVLRGVNVNTTGGIIVGH